jgi:hypothetical protein
MENQLFPVYKIEKCHRLCIGVAMLIRSSDSMICRNCGFRSSLFSELADHVHEPRGWVIDHWFEYLNK